MHGFSGSGSSNTITMNNDLKRNSFQDDQLYQSLVLHMVYLPLDSPILAILYENNNKRPQSS